MKDPEFETAVDINRGRFQGNTTRHVEIGVLLQGTDLNEDRTLQVSNPICRTLIVQVEYVEYERVLTWRKSERNASKEGKAEKAQSSFFCPTAVTIEFARLFCCNFELHRFHLLILASKSRSGSRLRSRSESRVPIRRDVATPYTTLSVCNQLWFVRIQVCSRPCGRVHANSVGAG